MTSTVAKSKLHSLTTEALIEQYDAAISSYSGRMTNHSPRQARIDLIVDMLTDRADHDDAAALQWFEQK